MFLATDAQISTDCSDYFSLCKICVNQCICGSFMSIQQNCIDACENMGSTTFLINE